MIVKNKNDVLKTKGWSMDIFGSFGLATIVIPFVVQQVKKVEWIGTKGAPIIAFACGVLVGQIAFWIGLLPGTMTQIQATILGISVGGTSTGLYDIMHQLTKKKK